MRTSPLVLCVLAACAGKPPCTAVPKAEGTPVLMWRAEREGAARLWVFGTIHHAGADDVPAEVWQVLEGAAVFVSEVGEEQADGERMRSLVRVPVGQSTLQQTLMADDWWELRDALRGVIREDDLKRMRAWYVMARLRATVAPPPDPTMDVALTARAQAQHLVIRALESPEAQLEAVARTVTPRDLADTLHERRTLQCRLADLESVYNAGNESELRRRLVVPQVAALLAPRNAQWLPIIEQISTSAPTGSSVFVAVGLGHLLGDGSLLERLQGAGYTVTRAAR